MNSSSVVDLRRFAAAQAQSSTLTLSDSGFSGDAWRAAGRSAPSWTTTICVAKYAKLRLRLAKRALATARAALGVGVRLPPLFEICAAQSRRLPRFAHRRRSRCQLYSLRLVYISARKAPGFDVRKAPTRIVARRATTLEGAA